MRKGDCYVSIGISCTSVHTRPRYWITGLSVCYSELYRYINMCGDWTSQFQENVGIKSIESKWDLIIFFDFLLATPNRSELKIRWMSE